MIKRTKIIFILAGLLVSCSQSSNESFSFINKDSEGKISIINQKSGKLILINKSNRIEDVIDLNIKDEEIARIKNEKESQDAATKIKSWGEVSITGEKYKVSLSTRHYKDKLLYTFSFMPADSTSAVKARSTRFVLYDENGFALEKINPTQSWSTIVDENGKAKFEQASGEVQMTLDNYLEVSSFSPLWSFR